MLKKEDTNHGKNKSVDTAAVLSSNDVFNSFGSRLDNINGFLAIAYFTGCSLLVSQQSDLIIVFYTFVLSLLLDRFFSFISCKPNIHLARHPLLYGTIRKNVTCALFLLYAVFVALPLSPYRSVGILCGVLVYDLWQFHVNPRNFGRIIEHAIVLSVTLAVLVKVKDAPLRLQQEDFRFYVLCLTSYKLAYVLWNTIYAVKLLLQLTNTTQEENSKIKKKRHEGEPLVNRKPFAELWQIHGKHYDLDNFISEHPGGTESILLGKGRDCTGMLPE